VTVTRGFLAEPGDAVLETHVTVRLGLVQAVGLPAGAAKPGVLRSCEQRMVLALVNAPACVVTVVSVATCSAASRVAASNETQAPYTRETSMAAPVRVSRIGRIRANSTTL